MSNPTNWPIVTDGETYLRHQEKRLLHEQRRPIVGHGNIIGPGISAEANEIEDWNDDVAATNGYFWSPQGIPNAPANAVHFPYGDGIDPFGPDYVPEAAAHWVGQTVSHGFVGYQSLRLLENVYDEDFPYYPEIQVHRQWKSVESGLRVYGPWRGNAQQPIRTFDVEIVGTGTGQTVATNNPAFDTPTNAHLYAAGEGEVWYFHIAITVFNDTAGGKSARFWPTLDGSGAAPDSDVGDFGWWMWDNSSTLGGSGQTQTASRSFFVYPTPGTHSVGVRILATTGLSIPWVDLYGFQVQ